MLRPLGDLHRVKRAASMVACLGLRFQGMQDLGFMRVFQGAGCRA